MGCNCRKPKAPVGSTTKPTPVGGTKPAEKTDGFVLVDRFGRKQTFRTKLEYDAARVRAI